MDTIFTRFQSNFPNDIWISNNSFPKPRQGDSPSPGKTYDAFDHDIASVLFYFNRAVATEYVSAPT